MRVAVRISDGALRRALTDLLTVAGHEVVGAGRSDAAPDLLVLSAPGLGAPPKGVPTLYLRPPLDGEPDLDPEASLAHAIATGGASVWSSPLDPARLVSALAPCAAVARPGVRRAPPESSLDLAPEPWALFEPSSGRFLWTNEAGRAASGGADVVRALLAERHAADLRGALAADAAGRRVVDGPDGRRLALWWTAAGGLRVLGMLSWPSVEALGAEGNLRTLAEIGRAASVLAHEIRNPIAALSGALDVLAEAGTAEERAEILGMARDRLRGMRALLDDVLRFARPFHGAPVPVDVGAVVASAVGTLAADPRFRPVEVKVDVPADAVTALAHEEPLRQALLNLLLNAAEAQSGTGRVFVRVVLDGDRVVLRVRDEGPGIRPEHLERVFEPFWTTKPSGTGLGLAYVRKVAEAAGGRATAESSERGACFRIDLRLVA
ncbi:MAG: HAMP domain-containing histidine kinase [Planctomycetes bacterium]|nr:HAMP domain-containing histidine kinase [Planctomycetota bacterium]